jgi:hypothetical protein
MLKGLPNDKCHCPHWGYVRKGKVTFTVDGRDEVYEPGDAFYTPRGTSSVVMSAGAFSWRSYARSSSPRSESRPSSGQK